MQAIRLQPALLSALKECHQDLFTIAKLTRAYQNLAPRPRPSDKSARQLVNRNIVRLLRAGLVERQAEPRDCPHYVLTDSFRACFPAPTETRPTTTEEKPSYSMPITGIDINTLQKRLSQHKSDLLCAMGEVEEYSAICEDHPNLLEKAQDHYNQARDRSAMLLGKIKALENLLSEQIRT